MARDAATEFLARKRAEQRSSRGMFVPPSGRARYMGEMPLESGKYTGAGPDGMVQPTAPTEFRQNPNGARYTADEGEVLVLDAATIRDFGGPEALDRFIQSHRPQRYQQQGAEDQSSNSGSPMQQQMAGAAEEMGMQRRFIGGTITPDAPNKTIERQPGTPALPTAPGSSTLNGGGSYAATDQSLEARKWRYEQARGLGITGQGTTPAQQRNSSNTSATSTVVGGEQTGPGALALRERGGNATPVVPQYSSIGSANTPGRTVTGIGVASYGAGARAAADQGKPIGATGQQGIPAPNQKPEEGLDKVASLIAKAKTDPNWSTFIPNLMKTIGTVPTADRDRQAVENLRNLGGLTAEEAARAFKNLVGRDPLSTNPIGSNVGATTTAPQGSGVKPLVPTSTQPGISTITARDLAAQTGDPSGGRSAPNATGTGTLASDQYAREGYMSADVSRERYTAADNAGLINPPAHIGEPTTPPPVDYKAPVVTPSQTDEMVLNRYLTRLSTMNQAERSAEAQRLLQEGASPEEIRGLLAMGDVSRREATGEAVSKYAIDAATRAEQRFANEEAAKTQQSQWQKAFDEDKSRYQTGQAYQAFLSAVDSGSATDAAARYKDWTGKDLDPAYLEDLRRQRSYATQTAGENLKQLQNSPRWNAMQLAIAAKDFGTAKALYNEITGKTLDTSTWETLSKTEVDSTLWNAFKQKVNDGMDPTESKQYLMNTFGYSETQATNTINNLKAERDRSDTLWRTQLNSITGKELANYLQQMSSADPKFGLDASGSVSIPALKADVNASKKLNDYWRSGGNSGNWYDTAEGEKWAANQFSAATLTPQKRISNTVTGSMQYTGATRVNTTDPAYQNVGKWVSGTATRYQDADGKYTQNFYDEKVIPFMSGLSTFGNYSYGLDKEGKLQILDAVTGKPALEDEDVTVTPAVWNDEMSGPDKVVYADDQVDSFAENYPDAKGLDATTMGQYLEANNGQPPKTESEWNKWYDKNVFLRGVTAKTGEMFVKEGNVYKVTGDKDGTKTYTSVASVTPAELMENPWSQRLTDLTRVEGYSGADDIVKARIANLKSGEAPKSGTIIDAKTKQALDSDKTITEVNPLKTSKEQGIRWNENQIYRTTSQSGKTAYFVPLRYGTDKNKSGHITFMNLETGTTFDRYNPDTTNIRSWSIFK